MKWNKDSQDTKKKLKLMFILIKEKKTGLAIAKCPRQRRQKLDVAKTTYENKLN